MLSEIEASLPLRLAPLSCGEGPGVKFWRQAKRERCSLRSRSDSQIPSYYFPSLDA
jgi:hypothetical protein